MYSKCLVGSVDRGSDHPYTVIAVDKQHFESPARWWNRNLSTRLIVPVAGGTIQNSQSSELGHILLLTWLLWQASNCPNMDYFE